jgi:hypothetical protein
MNEVGILFEDKHCTVRLLNINNQCDSYEWWWEEFEDNAVKTVFVVSYCPANFPGLVVHRMKIDEAQVQLDQLLTENWIVTRRGEPMLLKVPPVDKSANEYEEAEGHVDE